MVKSFLSLVFLALFLVSCATGGRTERAEFRTFIERSDYQGALNYLETNEFYQEPKVLLLKLLEKGSVLFRNQKYAESILAFDAAKAMVKELYTTSLSKKAETILSNDNADIYYGEAYEHSLVYFYLSLNHVLVAQSFPEGSSEKVQSLSRARAELLAWDSMLKSIQSDRLGRSVFKNDLLAKVFGGMVHELIGTRDDKQVAINLYKNAKEVLLKNGNAYKTFNKKSSNFKKDFEKLPTLKKDDLEKNYIEQTAYQENLQKFLDEKIKSLEKIKKEDKGQLVILVQEGPIPLKVAEKQYYGLTSALQNPDSSDTSKAIAKVGHMALTMFALNKLNLLPPPSNWSPAGAYLGVNVASFAADSANISFELPVIKSSEVDSTLYLQLNEKEEFLLPLVSPLGDIAEEAVAENSAGRYIKIGARLASKHLVAILSAYGTYKLMAKDKGSDFLATNLAVLEYAALARGIAASEKADTRQWSTLPQNIFVYSLSLKDGEYHPHLKIKTKSGEQNLDLGKVIIDKKNTVILNFCH